MTIFGTYFDLTFGPIFTVLVAPIIVWAVTRTLSKVLNKLDQASEERHTNVVNAIEDSKQMFMTKLDANCAIQEKLHKQIDERFWKHGHRVADDGSITEDIIIKGGGL